MVSLIRFSHSVAICGMVVALASASFAAEDEVWKHFAVGQASYQVEDPFEEEPGMPATEPSADEPPMPMPPDPAYQVPPLKPPARRVEPPAPLVPPEADADRLPAGPAPSKRVSPLQPDAWTPSCTDGCGISAAGCGNGGCRTSRGSACDLNRVKERFASQFRFSGWIAQGVTLNTRSPRDRSNFPVTFNDGSNEYQMNQLYLVAERTVRDDAWSVGGRVDMLYGTDHRYTMARGLEVNRDLSPKWNSEDHGLAMPQVYAEAFAPVGTGFHIKAGHFYTILGYETVTAPDNFFYSHAYTMQYGEPFTHTGVLAATDVGPVKLQAGVTRGWDNWETNYDEYGFLGGASWTSYDERTSLAFALHTGPEEGPLSPQTNQTYSRTTYSIVFSHNLYGPWSCVLQHDMGVDRNVVRDGSDARWYGLNMYLFREITEHWKLGYRFEWFRDDDGTRIVAGQAADYYQMSLGLNYAPSDRLRIRPSLRWDWTGEQDFRPFADGRRDDQILLDCDVILQF